MISKHHLPYGAVCKYESRIYTVIDTIFEDNTRKAVIEFSEDEEKRGDLSKITVALVKDLELVQDKDLINKARTRSRNVSAK